MKQARAGFSLVEISLVLVILGLLVGGVLAGQSLVQASQIRSVVTQQGKYQVALTTFKDANRYLPGDLPNAYQIYGAACGTNDTVPGSGCNGNGNGSVSGPENVLIWEHLAREGLIEGTYTGKGTVAGGAVNFDTTNSPASKIRNMYWALSMDADDFGNPWNNQPVLQLGSINPAGASQLDFLNSKLHGDIAYLIDHKMDDGFSMSGAVQTVYADGCEDYGTGQGQGYANRSPTTSCPLYFQMQ